MVSNADRDIVDEYFELTSTVQTRRRLDDVEVAKVMAVGEETLLLPQKVAHPSWGLF